MLLLLSVWDSYAYMKEKHVIKWFYKLPGGVLANAENTGNR